MIRDCPCTRCSAERERRGAVRLSEPTPWNRGGGETSATGPSASPSTSPMAPDFASLPQNERVEAVLTMRGPTCIAGCGRAVPVHGETCDWCWHAA